MSEIIIQVDDNSPEVLAALKNAIERGAMAIGETAISYAKSNITAQGAVDTGNLRSRITYMVQDE